MRNLLVLLFFLIFDSIGTVTAGDFTAGMLEVKDGEIFYEARGGGKAVVFIHGGYGDRRMWDHQFEEFAKGYRVVRYDHRGFGRSPKPNAAYSPVSDLVALLDHLEIDQAYFIGNSMGGTLVLDFVLIHPERVSGVVVVAAGAGGYPISEEDRKGMMAAFQAAQKKDLSLWLSNPMVAETKNYPGVREKLVEMVEENAGIFSMDFWPTEKMDPPAAQRLQNVSRPVLVIAGEKDSPLVNVMAKQVAEKVPGAKIVFLAGTDHLPQMEKPAEFNKIVRNFLNKH